MIWRDLGELYGEIVAGVPARLPELGTRYSDFVRQQLAARSGFEQGRVVESWRRRLAGTPVLDLPTDHPRPTTESHRGDRVPVVLPAEITHAVLALSRRLGATPFMILMAAFQVLLRRYSGQDDFAVGFPVAGRLVPGLDHVVGMFINTLPLRARLAGDPTFRDAVASVRDGILDALDNQDVPFERLVEEVSPDRDPSRSPLVQVMFAYQNFPEIDTRWHGLDVEPARVGTGTVKLDLGFYVFLESGELRGVIEYATDLFERATIERFAGHFRTLLEGALANPDRPISSLPLLTPVERERLLVAWNDTAYPVRFDRPVHRRFEYQVRRTPDARAVEWAGECGDVSLSFAVLDRRSNRVARALQRRGVHRGVRVGVCMERCPDLPAVLLGILKAGGVYVPLDPGYPPQWIAHVLADSAVALVVADAREPSLPGGVPVPVLRVDGDSTWLAGEADDPVDVATGSDDPAYVLYTSGSTGTTKGVAISHGSLANYMDWLLREFPLDATDRVLQKTPIGWDPSLREFFAPLLSGATLVLAPPDVHADSAALVRLVRERAITWLQLVPAVLEMFVDEPEIERCRSLRRLFVSGEALGAPLLARTMRRLGATVTNLYGPSETCMSATFWTCGEAYQSDAPPPIGRPISNVRLYVLDPAGEPVPVGVPGELYIGGAGVGKGYLNRPEATAERFVPDPFLPDPLVPGEGTRMFRSGDLVRYLPDGNLQYLGRIDREVKIQGMRVDLAEVEARLNRHPEVLGSAVVLRENAAGRRELVGYVVPAGGATLAPRLLYDFLREQVPHYMTPTAYVLLDRLPLFANGKVDRRALPAPTAESGVRTADSEPPRDDVEVRIAAIWREVLEVDRIGAGDDFFALGGHSLRATQVLSRINAAFDVAVALRDFFAAPTVEGLAERVREAVAINMSSPRANRPPTMVRANFAGSTI